MTIDICIPAFNEASIIARTVAEVAAVLRRLPHQCRVVVADSRSSDDTGARAKDAGADVMRIEVPGKGAAVIAAARVSTADVFGFIDADLSADPGDIPALIARIERGECDIIIGSRLLDERLVSRGTLRTMSSRLFNALRKRMLGISVRDTQCGMKMMNEKGRAVLAACREEGWFFDIEFLARAEKKGLRISEVPVHWDESRIEGRRSKLNFLRDGPGALSAIRRIRRALRY